MIENNNLISVILPVRNPDMKLLKRALSSVLAQSYDRFEILLIDDGSKKSSADRLDILAMTDQRIRLFHIKASGVSFARNLAVKYAKGDIITYIDGDDAIYPHCFNEAITVLKDEALDAVWGGTYYANPREMSSLISRPVPGARSNEELRVLTLKLDRHRIHQTKAECLSSPFRFGKGGYINRGIAARFIRKRLFNDERLMFPEGIRMYEDTIWNLRMMEYNICYVKAIWYYYLNNEKSVSNRYNKNVLKDIETPLFIIRRMTDTGNSTEYAAYTRFLMDSLRYVYKCLYGNPKWKPDNNTRRNYLSHIYKETPWREIAGNRYIKAAGRSDKMKALLYRTGLLFLYWKLTWKKM